MARLDNKIEYARAQIQHWTQRLAELERQRSGGRYSRETGECPFCGVTVRIRKDGKPFSHPHPDADKAGAFNCPGRRGA